MKKQYYEVCVSYWDHKELDIFDHVTDVLINEKTIKIYDDGKVTYISLNTIREIKAIPLKD